MDQVLDKAAELVEAEARRDADDPDDDRPAWFGALLRFADQE